MSPRVSGARNTSGRRRKILVYHLGFIGDTVVSVPALRALRRHYGASAEICLLHETHDAIPVSPADVLSGLGLVDRFLTYRFRLGRVGLLMSAIRLWARLIRERFDEVIYLAPSERSTSTVRRDELFFRLCGISARKGFVTLTELLAWSRAGAERPLSDRARHEARRKLDRLAISGIDVSAEQELSLPVIRLPVPTIDTAARWLVANRRHPERTLVAICPGSKNPANRWPTDRFIEIGRRLLSLESFELVVVGGPSDRAVAQQMLDAWGDGINAAGVLTVLGSAALLTRCHFMLGLDTGMTHLSGALGVGGVAIYGGRDPVGLWDPFGGVHTVLRQPVECAGCRLMTCPFENHPCMQGIDVGRVWAAMERFVAGPRQKGAAGLLEQPRHA
jgi:heptosyltransferase-3